MAVPTGSAVAVVDANTVVKNATQVDPAIGVGVGGVVPVPMNNDTPARGTAPATAIW